MYFILKVNLRPSTWYHAIVPQPGFIALLQALFHVLLLKSVPFQSLKQAMQSALSSMIYAEITGGEEVWRIFILTVFMMLMILLTKPLHFM